MAEAEDEGVDKLPPHALVTVVGLVNSKQYNDCEGQVCAYFPDKQRYKIVLDDSVKVLSVKRQNLVKREGICRFCFDEGDGATLLSPCKCSGSVKYIHRECLLAFQRSIILSQETHPSFWEDDPRMRICSICKTEFTCRQPTRREIMLSFTGEEVQKLVQIGSLIISTEENSQHMEKAYHAHPNHRGMNSCLHWIRGVFAITECAEEEVRAVNIVRNLEECPRARVCLFEAFKQNVSGKYLKYVHFIGGPCPQERYDPTCLVRVPRNMLAQFNFQCDHHILTTKAAGDIDVLSGPFTHMISEIDRVSKESEMVLPVHVFWGEAVWTRTQFLGEVARGDWGLCGMNSLDAFPGEEHFKTVWAQLWKDQRPIVTPKNDMKDHYDRERQKNEEVFDRSLRRQQEQRQRADEVAREMSVAEEELASMEETDGEDSSFEEEIEEEENINAPFEIQDEETSV